MVACYHVFLFSIHERFILKKEKIQQYSSKDICLIHRTLHISEKNLLENFHETDHSSLQSVALGFFIRHSR